MEFKFKYLIIFVFSPISVASERIFDFVPSEINSVVYENGTPYLQTNTNRLGLTLSFIPGEKNRGWIGIQVTNFSDTPVTISEKSLSIFSNQSPLRIYTYSELMAEQKRKDSWRRFGAAMTASTAPSPYSTQTGTYSSRTNATVYGNNGYSAYGTANTNGSYQSSSYDATAAAINQAEINRRNQEMLSSIKARSNAERAAIDERVLRANTLSRSETIYGEINFDLPKKSGKNLAKINLTITIGGESFQAELQEQ